MMQSNEKVQLLSSERIEPIILKLLTVDDRYTDLLSDHIDKKWFTDDAIGIAVEMIIKFKKTFKKLPTRDTLCLLVERAAKPENVVESVIKVKSCLDIDLLKYDSAWIQEEVFKYLKNEGMRWAIVSHMNDIADKHDISKLNEKLQFLSNMMFDEKLGLDYSENVVDFLTMASTDVARLPTGILDIDTFMDGGVLKDGKCLVFFSGEANVGKSVFLSNIAANMFKQGKFVVVVTLEMSEMMYASRISAHLAKIAPNDICKNKDEVVFAATNVVQNKPEAKLIIKEYAPHTVSCIHIKTYIEKLIRKYKRKIDCLIIDYVGLMVPTDNRFGNSYEKYGNVATEMRALSYHFSAPLISVNQMNRSGYGKTDPDLDCIADSMGIAHVADFIAAIYQNDGDREAGIINVKVTKNRLGPQVKTRAKIAIDYNTLTLYSINGQIDDQDNNAVSSDITAQIMNSLDKI